MPELTPFQADYARKAGGLREYQDKRMRASICAACQKPRAEHYGTGCRYQRMSGREWAEWCGVEYAMAEGEARKGVCLREVVETTQGGLTGLFRFRLECGHREERFLDGAIPKMPKSLRCAKCAKERENGMTFFGNRGNPNGKPAASGLTPAPARMDKPTAEVATLPAIRGNGNTELGRLVPNIEHAIAVRDVLVQALKSLMVRDTDYGTIPGTKRDTLLQPGANKLANLFQLTVRYEIERTEDWTGAEHGGEPFFYYVVTGNAFNKEGAFMGEGRASCNSWETKYRWRTADRLCPQCNQPNIRKSKEEGWYCWKKTGGCGATFADRDPAIVGQETGRKPNPDIGDLPNTLLKMAVKRAYVSTIITATSASEFFTQDVEDFTIIDDGIDTGGHARGTQAAANHVAEQKIASGRPLGRAPWKNMADLARDFQAIHDAVGEPAWRGELEQFGWRTFADIRNDRSPNAREKAWACYLALEAIARKGAA